MSERSNFFNSPEDEDDDAYKKAARRKKSQAAGFLADMFKDDAKSVEKPDQQDKAEADSLTSLFQASNKESGENHKAGEVDAEALSEDDESQINSELAAEHLENPTVSGDPEEEVTEFLNNVRDGTRPADAFNDTLNQIDESGEEGSEHESGSQTDRNEAGSRADPNAEYGQGDNPEDQPQQPGDNQPVQEQNPGGGVGDEETHEFGGDGGDGDDDDEASPVQPNVVNVTRPVAPPHITAPFNIRPIHRPKNNVKPPLNATPDPNRVRVMERRLSEQELVIQRLVQQNRENQPNISPPERSQLPNQESRLKLVKPERVGQIGKMAMERTPRAERIEPKAGFERRVVNEDVATMSRRDLLEISAKIIVNGASLKSMFENNLFSEKSLRKMVGEYLKGKDVVPLLKKELVSKETGFEDGLLKETRDSEGKAGNSPDHQTFQSEVGSSPAFLPNNYPVESSPAPYLSNPQPAPLRATPSTGDSRKTLIINVALALLAVLIIIFIVWLLLKSRT